MRAILSLLLLLLLGLGVYFFVFKKSNTTFDKESTKFSVLNTDKITQISITDVEGVNANLQRMPSGKWAINERYYVRVDAIEQLLKTLRRVRVYSPVPKTAYDNVMRMMKEQPKKVEIYVENKLDKTIIMSGNTTDKQGTYMMLDGTEEPYITHIPGFKGYLHRLFFTNIEEWRSHEAFDYKQSDVRTVRIDYFQEPEASFELEFNGEGDYRVRPINRESFSDASFNKLVAADYLASFEYINVEAFHNDYSKKDSVLNENPLCKMEVIGKDGKSKSLTIYPMFLNERSKKMEDGQGNPMKYDSDHYHAVLNEGNDFAVIQDFVFGPLFKKYPDFFVKQPQLVN